MSARKSECLEQQVLKQQLNMAKKEALFWKDLSQKNAELVEKLLSHLN